MRVFISGVTGFAGGHLTEALLVRPGVQILGVSRGGQWPVAWRHLEGCCRLLACDLMHTEAIRKLLAEWQPEWIIHLAGYAHVGQSFREPDAAWRGNLDATRCLYEAIQKWGGMPRVLFVGSGLVYGAPEKEGARCDEQCLLRPESPYAASKAAADLLSYQVWRATGLPIIRVRPFNHIGPRQSPEYAVAHFARQLVEIERGRRPAVLETGNLAPRRDLTDVRDIVRGYLLLLEHGRPGEAYNLGIGEAPSMREVIERLMALSGIRSEIRSRGELCREVETAVLRADSSRAQRETRWSPKFSLEQTLADILDYWRSQELPRPSNA